MTVQPRQPKGTPAGGEFAATAHGETGLTLQAPSRPHEHQTPREVDEQLAERYAALAKVNRDYAAQVDAAHWKLGHRKSYARSRSGHWTTGPEETLTELRTALEEGRLKTWDAEDAQRILNKAGTLKAEGARLREEMAELDGEYVARGRWSRFFLVTSSAGGHVHSSMSCHTCKVTTEYGWQPQLSGKTELDAVAEHGAILCTACFPSAPVEWTRGQEPAADTCPGSGQQSSTPPRAMGRSRYGTCLECGEMLTVGYGGIRKHKRKAS